MGCVRQMRIHGPVPLAGFAEGLFKRLYAPEGISCGHILSLESASRTQLIAAGHAFNSGQFYPTQSPPCVEKMEEASRFRFENRQWT